jgi:hypothetical protein
MAIDDNRARTQAQREQRQINSQQQGLGGTPLQGRNPVGGAGGWGGQASPSTVQGQGKLGQRQPDRTWQQSARGGAFGTGAKDRVRLQDDIAAGKTIAASGQQLKDRQSLFADMQKPGADMAALRQRGQALGVTDSGWAKGLAKAGTAPAASSPQIAGAPNLPTTNGKPMSPAPTNKPVSFMPRGATWQAKAGAPAIAPTTGSMSVQDAMTTTRAAIDLGKQPAATDPDATLTAPPPSDAERLSAQASEIINQPNPAGVLINPAPAPRTRGNGEKNKKDHKNTPYQSPGQGLATTGAQIAEAFRQTSTSAKPWWKAFTYQAPPSDYQPRS